MHFFILNLIYWSPGGPVSSLEVEPLLRVQLNFDPVGSFAHPQKPFSKSHLIGFRWSFGLQFENEISSIAMSSEKALTPDRFGLDSNVSVQPLPRAPTDVPSDTVAKSQLGLWLPDFVQMSLVLVLLDKVRTNSK